MRDVVAMADVARIIQQGGPDPAARESLNVLLRNADTELCLKVAVSMLASSWGLLSVMWAEVRGTTPEHELEKALAQIRDHLAS